MTDNSKFTIRWGIDNATARFATGRVESEVFNVGGFKWTAVLMRHNDNTTDFTLRCGVDHNGTWNCEAQVGKHLPHIDGSYYRCPPQSSFTFDENNCYMLHKNMVGWHVFAIAGYLVNDKVTAEFHIRIIKSGRGPIGDLTIFEAPNRLSNVVLKIGVKKLHVSKEFLGVHSPVFETLFFGNFAENGKEEVEIKDVVYEEFVDLLYLIYFRTSKITDRTVLHILKLADQYQIENVLEESKMYLTQSKGLTVVQKLEIADQYNLTTLRDHCLHSFTTVDKLKEMLKACPIYALTSSDNFSAHMKLAIYERIMKI